MVYLAEERVQHFYVAAAKYLFLHPEYGLVFARDPLRLNDATARGLRPLLLYGLSVPGTRIRWHTFTALDEPRSLTDVLVEAWKFGEGLRGYPDTLVISSNLSNACPSLPEILAKTNVTVEVARGSRSKSLAASLRFGQTESQFPFAGYPGASIFGFPDDPHLECEVDSKAGARLICAIETSIIDHASALLLAPILGPSAPFAKWMATPSRQDTTISLPPCQWSPGKWLSSWEVNVAPDSPRFYWLDEEDHQIWLVTGHADEPLSEDMFEQDAIDDDTAEIAEVLLSCWPNPIDEVAKLLGIKVRQIKWFLNRTKALEDTTHTALLELLGITLDVSIRSYYARGPYVLIAKNRKALDELYDHISYGGDASPYEVVPRKGLADPSYRYFVINAVGEAPSVVMAARGSTIADQMPEILFNYYGVYTVPSSQYRKVVKTCAKAASTPQKHVDIMQSLSDVLPDPDFFFKC